MARSKALGRRFLVVWKSELKGLMLSLKGSRASVSPSYCIKRLMQDFHAAWNRFRFPVTIVLCCIEEDEDTTSVGSETWGKTAADERWYLYSHRAQVLERMGCMQLCCSDKLAVWFLAKLLLLVFCSASKTSCHIWFQVKASKPSGFFFKGTHLNFPLFPWGVVSACYFFFFPCCNFFSWWFLTKPAN